MSTGNMYKRGEKFNVLSFDIVSQLVSNMLPQLDATFVINYLHNQASNDALTLDLVLPDDDVPFLDPSTFLAPASQLRIVKPYQNIRGKTSLRYDDRDYNMQYSRKLSSRHGVVFHGLVPENSLLKHLPNPRA